MPIGVATPVVEKDRVFFTSFYDGSLLLAAAARQARRRKALANRRPRRAETPRLCIRSSATPVFENGYIYGVDSYGELRCLDAADGHRVWEDKTAVPPARWSTIHFVKNGDRYFLFNERGELIIAHLSPKGYDEISRAKTARARPTSNFASAAASAGRIRPLPTSTFSPATTKSWCA